MDIKKLYKSGFLIKENFTSSYFIHVFHFMFTEYSVFIYLMYRYLLLIRLYYVVETRSSKSNFYL